MPISHLVILLLGDLIGIAVAAFAVSKGWVNINLGGDNV